MESITIKMKNLTKEERKTLMSFVEKANKKRIRLSDVTVGDTFEVGGITFIKFSEENGTAIVMTKDCICDVQFDDDSNNFSDSKALKMLKTEFLQDVIEDVGADNVLSFDTDLTTLDGLKTFGVMNSRVSLATLDFLRNNLVSSATTATTTARVACVRFAFLTLLFLYLVPSRHKENKELIKIAASFGGYSFYNYN